MPRIKSVAKLSPSVPVEETNPEKVSRKRGKKKNVENIEEPPEIKDDIKKLPTKRRPKKEAIAKNDKESEDIVTVPSKSKGRGKKTAEPVPNGVQETEAINKETSSRARKKKNPPTPSEEIEEKAPVKVPASRKRGKTKAVEQQNEDTVVPAIEPSPKKRAKKTTTTQAVSTTEDTDGNAAELTSRGRTKRNVRAQVKDNSEETPVAVTIVEKRKLELKEPKKEKKTTGTKLKAVDVETNVVDKPAAPISRGRKRTAPVSDDNLLEDNEDEAAEGSTKSAATKKAKKGTKLLNSVESNYVREDFELVGAGEGDSAKRYNLKISSWNVAGLRSWLKKDGLKFLEYEEPDIFCLQETKCANDQLPEEAQKIPGYHPYWLCMPGGYAGVAVYSKIMPINVEYGIGSEEFDDVGRMITAEYEKFFLINVYVPNSGRKLVNLELRMRWEKLFQAYVKKLDDLKPIVICGDMNVSHMEIDLANPKSNTRSAGFTKEERDKMTELLSLGFIDTFRHLYPDRTGAYTYWTYMANARSRNVGWRLDYFIVSERFVSRVLDNCIRSQCMGSDHCPITMFMKI